MTNADDGSVKVAANSNYGTIHRQLFSGRSAQTQKWTEPAQYFKANETNNGGLRVEQLQHDHAMDKVQLAIAMMIISHGAFL